MQETILNKLRQEHLEMNSLLTEITETKNLKLRKEIFSRFKEEMILHMEAEESILYSKVSEGISRMKAIELLDENNQEHHHIKELLQRLNFLDEDSDEWFETFLDLKESCRIHVDHEENTLFAVVKEDFTPEELIQLATDFEEAKHHHLV